MGERKRHPSAGSLPGVFERGVVEPSGLCDRQMDMSAHPRDLVATFIALALAASSCGGPATATRARSPASEDECSSGPGMQTATTYGPVDRVAGRFPSTAAKTAEWEENRNGPDGPRVVSSRFRSHPPDEKVTVCFYDGEFGVAMGPALPPPGEKSAHGGPPYARMSLIVIEDGSVLFDAAGSRGNLRAEGPPPGP